MSDLGDYGRQPSYAEGDEDNVEILHGTSYDNWVRIQTDPNGLNRMNRDAIHLSLKEKMSPAEAARSTKDALSTTIPRVGNPQVIIYIDKKAAKEDGIVFEGSKEDADGETVLTRGLAKAGHLPMKYFEKVIDAKKNVVLWSKHDKVHVTRHAERVKRIPRIDIHTHILPKNLDLCKKFKESGYIFLEPLEQYDNQRANMHKTTRTGGSEFFRQIGCNCYDHHKRREEMNATSVDVQALSTVPVMFSYWTKDKDDAVALARFLNDDIADRVKDDPKRFVGLGTLPMQFPEESVAELTRCVKDLGMCGVQIGSHIDLHHPEDKVQPNVLELSDPKFFPIWKAAEDLGAAVFVHPWDMMGSNEVKKYWLPWLVGMPAETSRSICHIIFSGVLDRFPKLRICFAHGGGSFPYTVGRIEHGFSCRPDLCAIDSTANPMSYVAEPRVVRCSKCGEDEATIVCDQCSSSSSSVSPSKASAEDTSSTAPKDTVLCSACDALFHARGDTRSHQRRQLTTSMEKSSKFFVDSLVHDPRALDFVIKIMGSNRVCLGSDYPFPLGEWRPGDMIAAHETLSIESKGLLLCRNACEFLGIKLEDFVDVDAEGLKKEEGTETQEAEEEEVKKTNSSSTTSTVTKKKSTSSVTGKKRARDE